MEVQNSFLRNYSIPFHTAKHRAMSPNVCVLHCTRCCFLPKFPEKFLRESGKPAFSKALQVDDTMLLQYIIIYIVVLVENIHHHASCLFDFLMYLCIEHVAVVVL